MSWYLLLWMVHVLLVLLLVHLLFVCSYLVHVTVVCLLVSCPWMFMLYMSWKFMFSYNPWNVFAINLHCGLLSSYFSCSDVVGSLFNLCFIIHHSDFAVLSMLMLCYSTTLMFLVHCPCWGSVIQPCWCSFVKMAYPCWCSLSMFCSSSSLRNANVDCYSLIAHVDCLYGCSVNVDYYSLIAIPLIPLRLSNMPDWPLLLMLIADMAIGYCGFGYCLFPHCWYWLLAIGSAPFHCNWVVVVIVTTTSCGLLLQCYCLATGTTTGWSLL